uniref:Uncharacterized protein n=1 Tax=Schizaphis graminum TaxID=13262 RepID=A0A2S2PFA7_SCHGA
MINHLNCHILIFNCIAHFKRKYVRAAGVAIYQNSNISHVSTTNIDLMVQNVTEINVNQAPVGDLCAFQIVMDNGREFLMVIVYILPNQKIDNIIAFLHRRLLPYSHEGSMLLKENLDKLSLILAEDFNVNFARDHSLPLITFFQEKFSLHINNDPREATTRHGTAIDGVFTRYLDNVISRTFVAYFSYHCPIVISVPANESLETSTPTVTEITNTAIDNIIIIIFVCFCMSL